MSDFELIESNIDISRLLAAIDSMPAIWDYRTFRQSYNGSAHADTSAIFLRWTSENTLNKIQNSTEAINFPELDMLPEIMPIISHFEKKIGAKELGRVLCVQLKVGGKIIPHADEGHYADRFERFHLCLQSDGSEFFVAKKDGSAGSFKMNAGDLWWFNHKRKHWAENRGSVPRINMILDAVAPKYRRERDQ